MSTPNAVVVNEIETILDKVLPFLPPLVQKVPGKIAAAVYLGLPAATGIFDLVAAQAHVSATGVAITDFVAAAIFGLFGAGRVNIK